MLKIPKLSTWQIVVLLISLWLLHMAYARVFGPHIAWHSFNFGNYGENEGIQILRYKYGTSNLMFTHGEEKDYPIGHGNIGGKMRVGDSLYVKWRVVATGKEYEDTVDLKSRLPWDMDDKIVHFAIKDKQLNVYLIEGNDSKHLHAKGAPDCPASVYEPYRCTKIYPEHWQNF